MSTTQVHSQATQVHSQENTNFQNITIITGATAITIIVILIITLFVVTTMISIKGGKCHCKDSLSTTTNYEDHEMTPQNTTVDDNNPSYDYPMMFDIKENVAYATINKTVHREE